MTNKSNSTVSIAESGYKNFLANYFNWLFKAVVGFIIYRYIVVKIPVDEYGHYSVFLSTLTFAGIFLGLGMYYFFDRYVPEFVFAKEFLKVKRLVRHVLSIQFVLSVCVGLIIYFYRVPIAHWLHIDKAAPAFIWLLFLIILQVLNGSFSNIFYSLLLHTKYSFNEIVSIIFKLIGIIIVLNFFDKTVYNLLIVLLISKTVFFLMNARGYSHFINNLKPGSTNNTLDYKRMLKFSIFKYLNNIGNSFLDISIDIYIITRILGSAPTAFYAFGMTIAMVLLSLIPSQAISSVISPILIREYKKYNDKNRLDLLFKFNVKINIFFSIPVILGASLLAPKIIFYVFDPKYLLSSTVFIIGIIGIGFFKAFLTPLQPIIDIFEKSYIDFLSKIFTIYNIIMNLILIRYWGIIGVAVATGSTFILVTCFEYFMILKYIHITYPFKSIIKVLVNTIPVSVFILFFYSKINSFYALLIVSIFGGLIYLLTAYLNRIFSPMEQDIFFSATGKKIFF